MARSRPAEPGERGAVDEGGELPPPEGAPDGSQTPQGVANCVSCPVPVYCCWPSPLQGALVAVQGTSVSATTDEDGWFQMEGVPLSMYQTIAATVPRGATIMSGDPNSDPQPALPYVRGAFGARVNVVVKSEVKPTNVGVIFVGNPGYSRIYYPTDNGQPVPDQGQGEGEPTTTEPGSVEPGSGEPGTP